MPTPSRIPPPHDHRAQNKGADSAFEAAWQAVVSVDGWLSEDQARRLFARARALPPGALAVEIGSYRGRSTIVLALAARAEVRVIAIDPHAGNDRGPREIHGSAGEGQGDHEAFLRNLEAAGVTGRVRHVRLPSSQALEQVQGPVALVYVDGAHRYEPAREDIQRWGERVPAGGTLLIHDAFSSVGVTLAIVRVLMLGGRFRYVGRSGSMAEYRRTAVRGRARVRNALEQVAELPWFARNVAVKLLLVMGLRPVARLLGHRSGDWPY